MTKLGWPAGERGRRLAWLGGAAAVVIALAVALAVVFWPPSDQGQPAAARTSDQATAQASVAPATSSPAAAWPVAGAPADLSTPLPGMPPVSDPANIYADAGANMLGPAVRGVPYRIYVPNSGGSTRHGHRPGHLPGDRQLPDRAATRSTSCPATTCAPST